MAKHLVSLTFDFDALSIWIAMGQTTPTALSRGEFGVVGARRILALLAAHGVLATWFIPGHTADTYPEVCREIREAGHEIGHHGYDHVSPVGLSREAEVDQLRRGNDALRRITGQQALGYRSPAWDLSADSVELLLAEGFVYDSSMMAHDYQPYRARSGDRIGPDNSVVFGAETTLWELPVSWSLDDFPHFEYHRGGGLHPATGVFDNWLEDYLYMAEHEPEGVITYTCHPFVIGRGHRMRLLERLIDALLEREARFVTATQALEALASMAQDTASQSS